SSALSPKEGPRRAGARAPARSAAGLPLGAGAPSSCPLGDQVDELLAQRSGRGCSRRPGGGAFDHSGEADLQSLVARSGEQPRSSRQTEISEQEIGGVGRG